MRKVVLSVTVLKTDPAEEHTAHDQDQHNLFESTAAVLWSFPSLACDTLLDGVSGLRPPSPRRQLSVCHV